MAREEPRYLPCGDTALTIQLGEMVDRGTNARVRALGLAVEAAGIAGVIETVPAYVSLTIHYDPLILTLEELIDALEHLPDRDGSGAETGTRRRWTLPVCFEGEEFAPDLAHVASWAGLAPDDVIGDLTATEQFVYMLGFAPGQPYLGDLPERLAIPRRKDPVTSVPAGSVLVATGKTVIYPSDNPTGWYVVGTTPVPMFDMHRKRPALLAPGDLLAMRRVDRQEYRDIGDRIRAGDYHPESEVLA